ncbi:MAG: outer membrane protein transport protein [Sandaracinaceae bacterium]|nr:outer membrane protein transport protein [Sandaracinaceae bacterium]
MRTRLGGIFVGVLLALALAIATPAHATPPDLFGFGARSPGLAMTGASHADNYEAVYLNPANLGSIRRRSFVFGASAGNFDLSLDHRRSPLEPARGTTIGFTLPIPFGDVLQDRLVLGGGFYTPTNVLLRGDVRFPEVPQWSVLGRGQSLALYVALGIDLHGVVDGLQVGVGIAALAALVGDLRVQLDETNSFQSVVETQLLATFSPTVGVRFEQPRGFRANPDAPPEFGVGMTYRHELRADMDLQIVVEDLPVRLPLLTIGGITQYDPGQIVIEGYWRPIPELRIIANVTARLWSAYPGPTRSTSMSSYLMPSVQFSDTFSPRVAVEGTLRHGTVEMALRGGYAFEMSPAPPARMAPQRNPDGTVRMQDGAPVEVPLRILDNDRHVFTLGFGLRAALSAHERLTLDLFGQAHVLADRQHLVALSSSDPSAAPMTTGGLVLVGGWAAGLEF